MSITSLQAKAARILVQWPRYHVARRAGLDDAALGEFEAGRADPGEKTKVRLRQALEDGGAVFIPEDGSGGVGVRLKFNSRDVRAINRLENEGGPVADDDV